jgi:hypothetical protein
MIAIPHTIIVCSRYPTRSSYDRDTPHDLRQQSERRRIVERGETDDNGRGSSTYWTKRVKPTVGRDAPGLICPRSGRSVGYGTMGR